MILLECPKGHDIEKGGQTMNKALLEYEMKRRGITAIQLSEYLGIDRSTFSKKCNGQSEFKQSEIQSIIRFLNIKDPTPIFFADEVS